LEHEVRDLRQQLKAKDSSPATSSPGRSEIVSSASPDRMAHMKAPNRQKLESFKAAVESRLRDRPTFGARNKEVEEEPKKEKKEKKKRFWSKKKKPEKVEVKYEKKDEENLEEIDDDHIPILYPNGGGTSSTSSASAGNATTVSKDFELQTKERLDEMQQVVMEQQRMLTEQKKQQTEHKKLTESAIKKIEKKMRDVPVEVRGGNSCQAMVSRAEFYKDQKNVGGIYGNQKQVLQQEQRMDDLQEKVLELESVVKTQHNRIQSLEQMEAKNMREKQKAAKSKGCCTIS